MKRMMSVFCLFLFGLLPILSNAQEREFVVQEGFETWPPEGWVLNPAQVGSSGAWYQDPGYSFGPYYPYERNYTAMFDCFNYNVYVRGTMTSPQFDVSDMADPKVTFLWYNSCQWAMDGEWPWLLVQWSEDGEHWNMLGDTILAALCGTRYELWQESLPKEAAYVRLQAISNYGGANTFVDFFHIGDEPMLLPSNLKVPYNSIESSQATVNWDEYGAPDSYEVAWGPKGFDPETAAVEEVEIPTYTISGLESGTEYEVCVRAVYGDEKTIWSTKISFTTLSACPAPESLAVSDVTAHSAVLSWVDKGEAASWNIEYGLYGFRLGEGTLIEGVTENPYTLENLPSGTTFAFYVQGDCPEDTSLWCSEPVSFSTLCEVYETPFYEDFTNSFSYVEYTQEGSYTVAQLGSPCWEGKGGRIAESGNTVFDYEGIGGTTWTEGPFANRRGTNTAACAEFFYETENWLISPLIDLGEGKEHVLQFDLAMNHQFSRRAPDKVYDDDRFLVVISEDGGETWNAEGVIREYDNTGSEWVLGDIPFYGRTETIDLSAYSGEVRIGFYVESLESNGVVDLSIDNVSVREPVESYLSALYVEAPEFPWVNQPNEVTVFVQNNGRSTQKDYTVELLGGSDSVLASVRVSEPVYAEEILPVKLDWIPEQTGNYELRARVVFDNEVFEEKLVSFPVESYAVSQETRIADLGDGYVRSWDTPLSYFYPSSTSQTIYLSEEIGRVGVITALRYQHNYSNAHGLTPVKIWMGETDKDEFASAMDWLPTESMTLVYDGHIDTIEGEGNLLFRMQQPYSYKGGNLVVMIQKMDEIPTPTMYSSGDEMWHTEVGANRVLFSLSASSSDTPDTDNGNLQTRRPNTAILIDSMSAGKLQGQVTDLEGNALADAKIYLDGTALSATSNAEGFYEIPMLLPDTYTVKAEKFGYTDTSVSNVVISDVEIKVVDLVMRPLPRYRLTGTVKTALGEPLRNAEIHLNGYEDYEASSISDGSYSIYDVYGTKEYTLSVSYPGYETFDTVFTVNGDMQVDVALMELLLPAVGLRAELQGEGESVILRWENPSEMTSEWFALDDGSDENGMSVMPYQEISMGNLYANSRNLYIDAVEVFGGLHEQNDDDTVYVDIYDQYRACVGTSNGFVIPDEGSVQVQFPYMVNVDADYYVMVRWPADRENYTNYLSADEDGEYADDSLSYYVQRDGTWLNMVRDMAAPPMVFMLRPHIYYKDASKVQTLASGMMPKRAESFSLWHLQPGSESVQDSWQSLTENPTTATSMEDPSWASYEMGSEHKYAVQVHYTGDYASPMAFSKEVVREKLAMPSNLKVIPGATTWFRWDAPVDANPLSYGLVIDGGMLYVSTSTTYSVEGLSVGKHRVELFAQYQSGRSASLTEEFEIEDVANGARPEVSVLLWPNPASDYCQVAASLDMTEIRLFDMQGRILCSQEVTGRQCELDVASLASGIYVVEVWNGQRSIGRIKLVVKR